MTKTITFNELRRIKDSLPDGSMHRIADEVNVTTQTRAASMRRVHRQN